MATLEGRTLTKHFNLDTKQHELFNLDLGEGIPRRMLVFGVVVTVLWWLLLWPIVGMPNRYTASLYLIPPVLLAFYGYRESDAQPRRKALTQWAIKARYLLSGHKPVIGLGARSAYRSEWLPLSQRWSRDGLLQRVAPWMVTPEWEREATPENAGPIQAGKPITLNQRGVALYGFDHMQAIRNRARKKVHG